MLQGQCNALHFLLSTQLAAPCLLHSLQAHAEPGSLRVCELSTALAQGVLAKDLAWDYDVVSVRAWRSFHGELAMLVLASSAHEHV